MECSMDKSKGVNSHLTKDAANLNSMYEVAAKLNRFYYLQKNRGEGRGRVAPRSQPKKPANLNRIYQIALNSIASFMCKKQGGE